MNNLLVYCEIDEGQVAEVSLELLTKARSLAHQLNCQLEAVAIGASLDGIPDQVFPYGVDILYVAEDPRLSPYTTIPHASIVNRLIGRQSSLRLGFLGLRPLDVTWLLGWHRRCVVD